MMKHTNDETLLIAEYTLGLLSREETSKAQALLNSDPQAVITALKWEAALLDLADRLSPASLPDSLWQEISTTLNLDAITTRSTPANSASVATSVVPAVQAALANPVYNEAAPLRTNAPDPAYTPAPASATVQKSDTTPTFVSTPIPLPLRPEPRVSAPSAPAEQLTNKQTNPPTIKHPRRTGMGQYIVIGGVVLLAAVGAAVVLISRPPAQPPVTVIEMAPKQAAILQAPGQSSTPGWIVTISPANDVLLNPQVHTEIPENASVQLWTYNKSSPIPRSLGLLDPNLPVTVPATLMGTIGEQQFFEMTQEAQGGSASGQPSGPVLFIGRIVTFGQ